MCEHAKNVSSEKGANDPPDRRPADSSTAAGAPAQRAPLHNSVERISQNESAIYEKLNDRGVPDPNGQYDRWTEYENHKKVKHYLIAWEDDDTAVLGVKAVNSPYGGRGYGLGHPALAGGTSDMSVPARDALRSADLPPDHTMRDRTLSKEVDQELWDERPDDKRNPYRLNVSAGIRFVSQGSDDKNVYKTWEGKVSRDPNDLQEKPPRPAFGGNRPSPVQAEQLAYYENTGTVRVKVSVLAGLVGDRPTNDEVLRKVAEIAKIMIDDGHSQAKIYLATDNYPLQAFAARMIEKVEEYRRAAQTTDREVRAEKDDEVMAEEDVSATIHAPATPNQARGTKRKAEEDAPAADRESETPDQTMDGELRAEVEEEEEEGEEVRRPNKRQRTEET